MAIRLNRDWFAVPVPHRLSDTCPLREFVPRTAGAHDSEHRILTESYEDPPFALGLSFVDRLSVSFA